MVISKMCTLTERRGNQTTDISFTAQEVAIWLLKEIQTRGYLQQSAAVVDIIEQFGQDFIYLNDHGNPAISTKVLSAFAKLKDGQIEWDRWDRSWRSIIRLE
jgi:hypothetical protein